MISLETQLEKIETEISSIQFMLFTTKGVTASSDQISGAPLIMMTAKAMTTMMMMIHILNDLVSCNMTAHFKSENSRHLTMSI